jgi:phosphatidate cytidylyltransferase
MLATRIASAVVMMAVVLAALFYLPPFGWALFVLVWIVVAAWEWAGFARLATAGRYAAALGVAILCLAAGRWTGLDAAMPIGTRPTAFYLAAGAFWLAVAPLWLARNPPRPAAALVLACGLAALVPTFLAVLELRALGAWAFLAVCAIVWVADIAAYFAGRALGRRKLAPAISPGKTWEGVGGALVAVALYALAVGGPIGALLGGRASLALLAAAALALAALSIVGDLFESSLKRAAGLKDSGRILPGHGGVLDRIDALLPVLPLAALGAGWLSRHP